MRFEGLRATLLPRFGAGCARSFAFLGQQGVEAVLKRLLINFINVDLQVVDIMGKCAFYKNYVIDFYNNA